MKKENEAPHVDKMIAKPESERHKEWLNEILDVEFHNIENPGLELTFSFGSTNNVEKYVLVPGQRYKLPRRVVQHIESRCSPVWKWKPNGSGIMEKTIQGYAQRFQCRQVFA